MKKEKIAETLPSKSQKLRKLSIYRIISNIQKGITFEAEAEDGSFFIKIDEYVPYVCAAIHDGSQLREGLKKNCILTEHERWYEEDPNTGNFIEALSIQVVGKDSRYEYDLNRSPESCVYDDAWGKQVWNTPLTSDEKAESYNKYNGFYSVIETLVGKLEKDFSSCVVYDIHSYNWKRWEKDVPIFNIGCENVNDKFLKEIDKWTSDLKKINLTGIDNHVAVNEVFMGRGYFRKFIQENFVNTLVLATEVKKVYCDEETGETYPQVIKEIKEGIKKAVTNTSFYFAKKNTSLNVMKKHRLLSSSLTKEIQEVDHELYKLCKDIEVLNYVNPINIEAEKKKFFASSFRNNPDFKYRHINFDPQDLKRQLYKVRIQDIKDVQIEHLYNDIMESNVSKANMLGNLGTPDFMYDCLSYFGTANEKDVRDAEFLVYAPEYETLDAILDVDNKKAVKAFGKVIEDYGFDCKIKVTDKIVAEAMVNNAKKTLLLKKGVMMSEQELNLLIHHEIGVHMVTTMNATLQPLNVFRLGLPVNTKTQEGLAVLAEYLSGTMDMDRLKELGLRVICIDKMVRGADFKKTFEYVVDDLGTSPEKAFYIVARAYRGGGFTKDQLYLKGFKEMYNYRANGGSLQNLLIGKTSIEYKPIVDEMVNRRLIFPPKYKTKIFVDPVKDTNPFLDYLLKVF